MSDNNATSTTGTVHIGAGITHCYPHNNKMPCAKCAREFQRSLTTGIDKKGGDIGD